MANGSYHMNKCFTQLINELMQTKTHQRKLVGVLLAQVRNRICISRRKDKEILIRTLLHQFTNRKILKCAHNKRNANQSSTEITTFCSPDRQISNTFYNTCCGETYFLINCWWGSKIIQLPWRRIWLNLAKLHVHSPSNPATPLLESVSKIQWQNMKIHEQNLTIISLSNGKDWTQDPHQ